jgi:hypothetical protein
MFFLIMGLPGHFSEWCDTVTAQLAERALGPTGIIAANTLEEISLGVMRSGASRAVVAARRPGGRLCAALVENRRNFIVALDDPLTALADLVLDQGVELAAATQAVASSCAALITCRSAPGVLILQSGRDWPQQEVTVVAVARHLQIAADGSEIANLVAGLSAGYAVRPRHDAIAWWHGLEEAERQMTDGALRAYLGDPEISEGLSIAWTRDLFFLGDHLHERATGPIDITGRPRCLLHGPYIMLPLGCWSLSLTMLFSREAAEQEFLVDVYADRPLASSTIRPQREGRTEVAIDFALGASTEQAIAIRVSSVSAAFDGAITLVGAKVVGMVAAADASPAGLVLAGI